MSSPKATSQPNPQSTPKPAPAKPVRVRFAPSPTGYLHVGSIRSGLFNWLWARHNGGVYVLRVEDTDRARLVPGALDQILDTHDALGITPDESPRHPGKYGPYLQSERLDIYRQHADQLIETGALYRCWCTPERLTALREAAQKVGVAFKYDRHCLRPENHGDPKDPHVLRFRIPDAPEAITWDDAVRGPLSFDTGTLDDFVALKADGYPTYHFANVVDDHLMLISHVLRADEWIPSTPKHLLLFAAFGWQPPIYAHLPAVQGPTGTKKLSKRDGAQSVQEYLDEGYLPEALRSYLATLGWNDGTTQEVYTTPELIKHFTLDRIQKSPAQFDKDRLTWVNGMMIRDLWQTAPQELLERTKPFWPSAAARHDDRYRQAVLGLVQDRLKHLNELPGLTDFFFTDPDPVAAMSQLAHQRTSQNDSAAWLEAAVQTVSRINPGQFHADILEHTFREQVVPRLQLDKPGPLFMALRIVLTGKTATPGLFETMAVLGRDTTLRRLQAAARIIASAT
jgi:glutamyl-tRNA synthetase